MTQTLVFALSPKPTILYHEIYEMEANMFSPIDQALFIMPLCYHPTTVIAVDDDVNFLQILSAKLSRKLPLMTFSKPKEAMEYTKNQLHYFPFIERCLIEKDDGVTLDFMAIRNEIYNSDRFKEVIINVTDYDMPETTGLDLISHMEFQPEISQYAHIILTGKISDDFKRKVAKMGLKNGYIRKDNPDYVNQLLSLIEKRSSKIFQWYSYVPARILSRNRQEKTSFLFDGNFIEIFNAYIKAQNICELYLFDKQGSYLFLDDCANLSWLFIRSDVGIENSIALATEYAAPKNIIKALQTKEVILSLYEKEDFKKRQKIEWEKYLLPAKVFESNDTYLEFFPNLLYLTKDGRMARPKYYYAFTNEFPENGIEQDKILSYQSYLKNLE